MGRPTCVQILATYIWTRPDPSHMRASVPILDLYAAFDKLIMLFCWMAYLYGLKFMVLQLTGSNPIFQMVYSTFSVHRISLNFTKVAMTYHKAKYLDLFFSRCILLLSVHFISSLSITICTVMIPKYSFPSIL